MILPTGLCIRPWSTCSMRTPSRTPGRSSMDFRRTASPRRRLFWPRGARPQTSGAHQPRPDPFRADHTRRRQGQLARERVIVAGRHYLVVGGALPETHARYYFFYDEQQVWNDLAVLRNVLAVGWLVLVVLAGLGGTLFARRTLAPVAEASNAARSIAEGLLDTRLPIAGDDEFGAWASAFNDMAAALEARMDDLAEARERERRFTANVAHDLRSPLTALIGEAQELAIQAQDLPSEFQRMTQMLVTDVDRMCQLTENLLEISRLDSNQEPPELEPVDVAALVKGVLRSHVMLRHGRLGRPRGRSHHRPETAGTNRGKPRRERHDTRRSWHTRICSPRARSGCDRRRRCRPRHPRNRAAAHLRPTIQGRPQPQPPRQRPWPGNRTRERAPPGRGHHRHQHPRRRLSTSPCDCLRPNCHPTVIPEWPTPPRIRER